MGIAEPEKLVMRRVLPFVPVALVIAFALGAALGNAADGWSALLGVCVVAANFVAFGLSIAWAARISPVAIYAVGLGGFLVRLVLIVGILLALNTLAWFSPVAFVSALVPSTAALLAFEMKVISERRLQADLWYFREKTS